MKPLAPVAAVAATVLVLAGCAAGGGGSPTASSSARPSTVTPGTLTVAADQDYPPEIYKKDDGSLAGFDVDIVAAIGKQLGLKVAWKEVKFEQAIIGLQGSQYDIYPGLYLTADRLSAIDMVPYFETGDSIVAKKGASAPKTTAALCGTSIGVIAGASVIAQLQALSTSCTDDGKKAIDVRSFPSDPEASQAVVSGNVGLQITSSSVAADLVAKQSQLKIANSTPIFPSVVSFGITKGNTSLDAALTSALAALKSDGRLAAIYREYGLSPVRAGDVASAKKQ